MTEIQERYEEFRGVAKLIIKTNISRNSETLSRYRVQIIDANNKFVKYVKDTYEKVNDKDREKLGAWLQKVRETFIKCLECLNCERNLPDIDQIIDDSHVGKIPAANQEDSDLENEDNSDQEDEMAEMTPIELFNAVNRQFRNNYDGEPLGLTAFLDSVDLLSEFAVSNILKAGLLRYVRAKLEGRARELVTPEVNTIEELKRVLQENISPESSDVIRGRLSALKYAYARQEDFAAKAEALAEGLRRALHLEGMSSKMAHETSVKETVNLCRRSTNSDLVKSIIMSTQFKNPKEVIAKLITESDTYVREQQILRFKKATRGNNNGNNNGNNKKGYDRNNGSRQQGQNDRSNNKQNNNGNFRGRGGNRGRGGGRGNGNYYNNNGNYNNGRWTNNNNGQAGPSVRVAHSGNEQGPQQNIHPQLAMGAQNYQDYQNYQ